MVIEKSQGTTDSERYLAVLCERAFLSLWSYPKPYRDQGDGKEICDLLVVFKQHILIFSDKDIAFKNTGNLKTDWGRWVKKAVLGSANTVYGAERWIREHPERVYLDKQCQIPFPIQFPSADTVQFHRIVVARNATERFREQIGGLGSLIIAPHIMEEEHLEHPFHIGRTKKDKGYVHILDDVALDILLYELDTITDFVGYLTAKERLITSGKLLFAPGEEDLLGFYLRYKDENNDFRFDAEKKAFIHIDEGFYADLVSLPQYIDGKEADKVSYLWDALIEDLGEYALNIEWYYTNAHTMDEAIIGLRCMASETRLARRVLSTGLSEKIALAPFKKPSVRIFLSPTDSTIAYVFLFAPQPFQTKTYEDYRKYRLSLLVDYCKALKDKWSDIIEIVGIATDSPEKEANSAEITYQDTRLWITEDLIEAKHIRQEQGLLQDSRLKRHEETVYKYPLSKKQSLSHVNSSGQRKREQKRKKKKQRKKTQQMKKKKAHLHLLWK